MEGETEKGATRAMMIKVVLPQHVLPQHVLPHGVRSASAATQGMTSPGREVEAGLVGVDAMTTTGRMRRGMTGRR